MAKKIQQLTGKQTKHLKGLGHHLPVVAMVGREGMTKTLIIAVEEVLRAHELVKIKIQNNCPFDRDDAAQQLSEATGATVVQLLGKTVLLFRANDDPQKEDTIHLP
nr:ribosome assembly RNA-binding protein YhbY [Desulfobulbaceae bacterium]